MDLLAMVSESAVALRVSLGLSTVFGGVIGYALRGVVDVGVDELRESRRESRAERREKAEADRRRNERLYEFVADMYLPMKDGRLDQVVQLLEDGYDDRFDTWIVHGEFDYDRVEVRDLFQSLYENLGISRSGTLVTDDSEEAYRKLTRILEYEYKQRLPR